MIASGPGGPLPPIRSGGEVPAATNARLVAGAVSGAQGNAIASVRTETAAAIDPARQTAAVVALPGDETNERARAARGLVEPSRAAASMLTGEAPTESTPAGPPPTFEVSILEKARAVASAAPPRRAARCASAPEGWRDVRDVSGDRRKLRGGRDGPDPCRLRPRLVPRRRRGDLAESSPGHGEVGPGGRACRGDTAARCCRRSPRRGRRRGFRRASGFPPRTMSAPGAPRSGCGPRSRPDPGGAPGPPIRRGPGAEPWCRAAA